MKIKTEWTGGFESAWCSATVTDGPWTATATAGSERHAIRRARKKIRRRVRLQSRLDEATR